MKHVKLLDCTLRDGAYLIDKRFGDTTINGIISGLVITGVEFIEIGFFQNEGFGEGKTVFKNSEDAKRFIPKEKKNTRFAVLADYSRFDVDNLDVCDGTSIDTIRECFLKNERFDALRACEMIKQKGYRLFVQPVDILGYTDIELIEFIKEVNRIDPYCISIVDTFGSMYQEDLHRLFEIIDHNLIASCHIGFHSHNNMQLSNALSQEFARISVGRRDVIIDGTLNGMGRGAGNTPTELIAQYLNSCQNCNYNMDALLDVIDDYMNNIRTKCSWGYNTPYFVAGCYGAHVNNISYLMKKNTMRSRDLRLVLNNIGCDARKRYDYELLDKTYSELIQADVDDEEVKRRLGESFTGKRILIVAPGLSSGGERKRIDAYIKNYKPIVISINFVDADLDTDYIFMSNVRRYEFWKNNPCYLGKRRIVLSSIKSKAEDANEYIVSYHHLIKCGWKQIDNAMILLLRLLDNYMITNIAIAGFDGYSYGRDYNNPELELATVHDNPTVLNDEISNMIEDFMITRKNYVDIFTITTSRFSRLFETR